MMQAILVKYPKSSYCTGAENDRNQTLKRDFRFGTNQIWLSTLTAQEQRIETRGVWSGDETSNLKTNAAHWIHSQQHAHSSTVALSPLQSRHAAAPRLRAWRRSQNNSDHSSLLAIILSHHQTLSKWGVKQWYACLQTTFFDHTLEFWGFYGVLSCFALLFLWMEMLLSNKRSYLLPIGSGWL